jgi:hypothetical protein
MGNRVWMRDQTWDAFMDLEEPMRAEAIEFLCALVVSRPEDLGIHRDRSGYYVAHLASDCIVPS